jgi:hypothetical protein
MDQNVKLAQILEDGTLAQTNVYVQHQKQYGMETSAFAIKIYMETIVFLVQLLEYGTFLKTNVFVQLQRQSGVE